jgi:hypothetical protein
MPQLIGRSHSRHHVLSDWILALGPLQATVLINIPPTTLWIRCDQRRDQGQDVIIDTIRHKIRHDVIRDMKRHMIRYEVIREMKEWVGREVIRNRSGRQWRKSL